MIEFLSLFHGNAESWTDHFIKRKKKERSIPFVEATAVNWKKTPRKQRPPEFHLLDYKYLIRVRPLQRKVLLRPRRKFRLNLRRNFCWACVKEQNLKAKFCDVTKELMRNIIFFFFNENCSCTIYIYLYIFFFTFSFDLEQRK